MRKHISWMIVLSTLFSPGAAHSLDAGIRADSKTAELWSFGAAGPQTAGPAWLGVAIQDVPVGSGVQESRRIVEVVEVTPGGPAANAGIQPGDFILSIERRPIADTKDLVRTIQEHQPGSRVGIRLLRGKQLLDFSVTLSTAPKSTTQNSQTEPIDRKKLAERIEAVLSGSPNRETTSGTPSRPTGVEIPREGPVSPGDTQGAATTSNPRQARGYAKSSRGPAANFQRLNPHYSDFEIAAPIGWEFQQGQDENPIIVGRGGPAGPSLTIWMWIRVTPVAENMTAADLIGDANRSLNACGPLEKAVSIHTTQWSPSQSAELMVAYLRAIGEPQARLISEHGIARNLAEARIASEVQGVPVESSTIISMDYFQDPGYTQQIALMSSQCPGIPALPAWESLASVVSCRAPSGTLAEWQPVCAAIWKSFSPHDNWLEKYAEHAAGEVAASAAQVGDIVGAITTAGRSRVQSMQDYTNRNATWGLHRADAHGYQGQPVDETGAPLPYKISGEFKYNCIEKDGGNRGTNDPYDKGCISITQVQ